MLEFLTLAAALISANNSAHAIHLENKTPLTILAETSTDQLSNNSITDTLEKFKALTNKSFLVPKYVPFKATQIQGSFNELDLHAAISYFNATTGQRMNIHVFSSSRFKMNGHAEVVHLSEGMKAIYEHDNPNRLANTLIFEKDGLEYRIGIKNGALANLNTLESVANSLDHLAHRSSVRCLPQLKRSGRRGGRNIKNLCSSK